MYEELVQWGITIANLILLILNTYLAIKRTTYTKETLDGSKRYWGSWRRRSRDVAQTVLKEIELEDLEAEIERRKDEKKRKKDSRKS